MATLAQAIRMALHYGEEHLGVTDIQMPCTPERVWRAIQGSKAGGATDTPPDAMPHFQEGSPNQDEGAGQ